MTAEEMREKHTRAFTLVETLVAVAILAVVLAGYLSLAQEGLSLVTNAKQRTAAFYLANDAMEYIKNIRATDLSNRKEILVPGSDFYTVLFTNGKCDGANGCALDTANGTAQECVPAGGQACQPLRFDDATSLYTYGNVGVPSAFTRVVRVVPSTGLSDEAAVSVEVSWEEKTGTKTYTLTRMFYDFEAVVPGP